MTSEKFYTKTQGLLVAGRIEGDKKSEIWYTLSDCERYVYHYTKARTLIDSILPDGRFRFSRFENVNDPREAKDWVFSLAYRSDGWDEPKGLQKELNRYMKSSSRLGCFVSDSEEACFNQAVSDEAFPGSDLYERGFSHLRMWSQYGDEYRGVCLVFERDQLDANISTEIIEEGQNIYSSGVTYKNPSVVPDFRKPHSLVVYVDEIEAKGLKRAADRHLVSHRKELFFTKAVDWKEEREFRWLVTGCKEPDFSAAIGSSLVGVLLGDKFPRESRGVVAEYAQKLGFSIAELSWQNGVPQPMPVPARILMQESIGEMQGNEQVRTSFLKQWLSRFWNFLHF